MNERKRVIEVVRVAKEESGMLTKALKTFSIIQLSD